MIGKRFGRLVVIKKSHCNNGAHWECLCDCGNRSVVYGGHLRAGSTISCGCLLKENRDRFKAERLKHGETNHKLFSVWMDMVRRCYSKSRTDYKNYGGRGIVVCDRWLESFINFLNDVGERPKGHTLERIDTNGNYEPGNVKWATRAEQNRNSRHAKFWHIRGFTFESAFLAGKHFGVCHATIINWCKSNRPDCYSEPKYV